MTPLASLWTSETVSVNPDYAAFREAVLAAGIRSPSLNQSMNPIQKQQITEALPNVQPLLDALAGLPDQGSADPTVRQCLDAGRSLAEWTTRLAVESPTAKDTTIPKEVLEHVVTVARFANGSAFKLFTKAVDAKNDKLAAQYKWVADLTNYLHRVFAVLWWDYIPPAPPTVQMLSDLS